MIRNIIIIVLFISVVNLSGNIISQPKCEANSNLSKIYKNMDEPNQPVYKNEIEKWRAETEARLKSDQGWLTVAGLHWLKEGENRIGTDIKSDIVLPANSAPAHIGTIVFLKDKATFTFKPSKEAVNIALDGKVLDSEITIKSDADGTPNSLTINELTMFIIKRGERYGIRLRDKNSAFRKNFKGMHWYEVSENLRVEAKFIPHDKPKTLSITSILGDVSDEPSPGYVVFNINGQECKLDAEASSKGLFFNFKDLTNGKTTYPAGRFLYTDSPKDGKVILDFNKAVNPPCAFTAYATCPLPPQQNRLQVKVEAGELNYHYDEETH